MEIENCLHPAGDESLREADLLQFYDSEHRCIKEIKEKHSPVVAIISKRCGTR